jgi:hypothetical protein
VRKRPRPLGYHWSAAGMVRQPDGGRSCRWCLGPIAPPKRNWCADPACLEEWLFRTRAAVFRSVIYARDGGRCRACGLDLSRLDLNRLVGNLYLADLAAVDRSQRIRTVAASAVSGPDGFPVSRGQWLAWIGAASDWRARHRLPPRRSAWEVDHIKPVSEGGEYFEKSNLQTLCVPCHRIKTAAGNRKATV